MSLLDGGRSFGNKEARKSVTTSRLAIVPSPNSPASSWSPSPLRSGPLGATSHTNSATAPTVAVTVGVSLCVVEAVGVDALVGVMTGCVALAVRVMEGL